MPTARRKMYDHILMEEPTLPSGMQLQEVVEDAFDGEVREVLAPVQDAIDAGRDASAATVVASGEAVCLLAREWVWSLDSGWDLHGIAPSCETTSGCNWFDNLLETKSFYFVNGKGNHPCAAELWVGGLR